MLNNFGYIDEFDLAKCTLNWGDNVNVTFTFFLFLGF